MKNILLFVLTILIVSTLIIVQNCNQNPLGNNNNPNENTNSNSNVNVNVTVVPLVIAASTAL